MKYIITQQIRPERYPLEDAVCNDVATVEAETVHASDGAVISYVAQYGNGPTRLSVLNLTQIDIVVNKYGTGPTLWLRGVITDQPYKSLDTDMAETIWQSKEGVTAQ